MCNHYVDVNDMVLTFEYDIGISHRIITQGKRTWFTHYTSTQVTLKYITQERKQKLMLHQKTFVSLTNTK